MRVRLISDGVDAPVSPFVSRFICNICIAMVSSLKNANPDKELEFELQGGECRLEVDGLPVPLNLSQGFATTLVRETLRGLLKPLKGVDLQKTVHIIVEFEDQP
jgi:hypothetical protein